MRRANVAPSLECYAHVVAALSAAGRPAAAARWLRRVVQPEISQLVVQRKDEKAAAGGGGKSASLEEHNRVLSAYAAAGRPAEAQEAMRAIAEAGLTPDRVSFNCLIAAHAAACAQVRAAACSSARRSGASAPTS